MWSSLVLITTLLGTPLYHVMCHTKLYEADKIVEIMMRLAKLFHDF